MKLRCPACHAEAPIEVYLGADSARRTLVLALKAPAPLADLLVQYLSMFRAKGRALSFDRVEKLLQELLPMIDRGQVTRNGIDRVAPLAAWQAGLEQIVESRNQGKLTLPLKSHGYLLEILCGLAERAAVAAEQRHEDNLRAGRHRQPESPRVDAMRDRIGRVSADLRLGIVTEDRAREILRECGMPEAAIEAAIEQNRLS